MKRQRVSPWIAAISAIALAIGLAGCDGTAEANANPNGDGAIEAPRAPEGSEGGGLFDLVRLGGNEPVVKTVPAGSRIEVRTTTTLSTKAANVGDTFVAHLSQPLVVDGETVAPKGARAIGKVVVAERSGRVKGRARLGVQLIEIETVSGDEKAVETDSYLVVAKKTHTRDAQTIGVGAGVGAAIGAIAGGGDGAAKGAGVGAGAGTGAVLATRGAPAEISSESVIGFELTNPVSIEL